MINVVKHVCISASLTVSVNVATITIVAVVTRFAEGETVVVTEDVAVKYPALLTLLIGLIALLDRTLVTRLSIGCCLNQ